LARFFDTLIAALSKGSRAVFQFYPESDDQVSLIMNYATRAGFGGGLVIDYPNSKKVKKFYLVLMAGQSDQPAQLPAALGTEEGAPDKVTYEQARGRAASKKRQKGEKRTSVKSRDWILEKKELYRRRGKDDVPRDSKYTGRKRRVQF
jgi:18S rRNA (guanine1575-N7)-methyltransferase